jgi:hypothetical protein
MGRSIVLVKRLALGLGVRGFTREDCPNLASVPVNGIPRMLESGRSRQTYNIVLVIRYSALAT